MMSHPMGYGPAITSGMALTVNGSRKAARANSWLRMAETSRETLVSSTRKTRLNAEPQNPIYCLFGRRLTERSSRREYNFFFEAIHGDTKSMGTHTHAIDRI